jgi:hypothetical protein
MTKLTRKLAVAALATVALSVPAWCGSALSAPLSGSIAGFVRDGAGIPQMGASVFLMNRYERVIRQSITNERGIFGFDTLPVGDFYSIRVSLASFVPAMKHGIAVKAGMQSLLYINMASVLSSVELVYAAPGQGALMSDDWKWTLRSSSETRPVMRMLPAIQTVEDHHENRPSPFSDTRGVVQLSAGDNGSIGATMAQADLGTAFAVATSLYDRNQLLVSGNVGYLSDSGLPTAGFRTTWTRDDGAPEMIVTVRQISLPDRDGAATSGQQALPALRTVSAAMVDHVQILDSVRLDYGTSFDAVSFEGHANYFSPYARLTCELGGAGQIQVGYSYGAPPIELYAHSGDPDLEMNRDLAALASLPRLSLRDGQVEAQQTSNMEIGYQKRAGSRVFDATAWSEKVQNAAATLSGATGAFSRGDLLPDVSSNTNVANIGSYSRTGFSGSVTQRLRDWLDVGAAVGSSGVLEAIGDDAVANPKNLRSDLRIGQDYWASARASVVVPGSGTRITASYEWMPPGAMMPAHFSLTQDSPSEPGLNVHFRQPIPAVAGLPGRMEATADLQNLAAQGYLSLTTPDSQRLLLTQNPRAVRGGLSFIF